MLIRRNDPARDLQLFQDRFNRLVNGAFGDFFPETGNQQGLTAAWSPAVDILETKDGLVLTFELPGFKQEDLTLRVENGVLSLEGERKFESESADQTYHRVERSYGRFLRSFTLPGNVDPEKIGASLNDGVLRIELTKKEEAKPRRIEIGISKKALHAA